MPRAKEFDYDVILDRATDIFLEKGYEHTSVQDLVDHLGIHRRSIYDTYGDKRQLYLKILNKYDQDMSQNYVLITAKSISIREKFEAIFNDSAFPKEECRKGCLFVNSAIELALRDGDIADQVQHFFEKTKSFFVLLLNQAKEKGELAADTDTRILASYLNNALIGIRVLVRSETSRTELENIIKTTLSIL